MKFLLLLLFIIIFKNLNLKKLELSDNIKYLEYSFKRNLTINEFVMPEEIFKNYFYNQIYINIKVGSNKIEIPFYLYLQQFPFVIESSNVSDSQVKGIYNETESKTNKLLKIETFTLGDLLLAFLSEDFIYYNKDVNIAIKFYLSKKNIEESHITEGGKIGFKPFPSYGEEEKASFIDNLKINRIISSKIFSLKYDSNKIDEDFGKLYIGEYLHNIFPTIYKDYISDNAEKDDFSNIYFGWIYTFDEIKIDSNIIDTSRKVYFYFELGFIIGNKYFFNYLNNLDTWNELFKNEKCHEYKFKINDFERNDYNQRFSDDYTGYYCDKSIDVTKINYGNILFIKKEKNITFNLNINELWMEKYDYIYFMIIKSDDYEDLWYFGKPFFKKFQMVFDIDNKQIGLYKTFSEYNDNNENTNKSNFIYILVIVGLVLIIIVLAFLLYKCYKYLPRKKRANELNDDDYEFSKNNNNVLDL